MAIHRVSLQHLRRNEDDPLSASKRDELIRHLRRQMITNISFRDGASRPWEHPWRVTARRFEAPDGGASLDPETTWRLDLDPGAVNDTLPSFLYRRENDPRGWQPGDGFVMPVKSDKDFDSVFVERDLLDDLDDPPFLALQDPPRIQPAADAAKLSRDFSFVSDEDRPDAFKSEHDWKKELWVAHVLLSASPLTVGIFQPSAPPRLKRYRIYSVPKLPVPSYGARAGGWLELATVYLLRTPDAPDDAELRIRQREWWPLWSVIVTPGAEVTTLADVIAQGAVGVFDQIFADIARAQIADILEAASSVEWWTV